MLMAMITAALVFFRLAAQYVHPQPTLYDKVLEGIKNYRDKKAAAARMHHGSDAKPTVDVEIVGSGSV